MAVFTSNRDQLLPDGNVAAKFMAAVPGQPRVKTLLSDHHVSVDACQSGNEPPASSRAYNAAFIRIAARFLDVGFGRGIVERRASLRKWQPAVLDARSTK